MPERFAIYYAPAATHPLWRKAAEWLGRDALTGEVFDSSLAGIERKDLLPRSASARRYGFHATIRAPMALADGKSQTEIEDALSRYAAATAPVAVGKLKLELIGGFLALVPATQTAELTAFAADVVRQFEPFRAPLSADDRARRTTGSSLTDRQVDLLDQYGYPYVLEQFQMHMTLTDRLPEEERESYRSAASTHFGALAEAEILLDRLVLFHEPEPGAPFVRLGDYILSPEATRE
jgi:putative phosphonate metabolism protein